MCIDSKLSETESAHSAVLQTAGLFHVFDIHATAGEQIDTNCYSLVGHFSVFYAHTTELYKSARTVF